MVGPRSRRRVRPAEEKVNSALARSATWKTGYKQEKGEIENQRRHLSGAKNDTKVERWRTWYSSW